MSLISDQTLDQQTSCFASVAIAVPLRRLFEYQIPHNLPVELQPGMRVEVPFSGRNKVGIVVKLSQQSQYDPNKLKSINSVLDDSPLVNAKLLKLVDWMRGYYHAPPGEVWQTVLPTALMKGEPCRRKRISVWQITETGKQTLEQQLIASNAVKQQQAMTTLASTPQGISHDRLSEFGLSQSTLKTLAGKQWVSQSYPSSEQTLPQLKIKIPDEIQLNIEQQKAIDAVGEKMDQFQTWLLFGVTASGKTEVYLRIIEQVVQQNKQALILVPEIGLTPQTVCRFQQRFNLPIEVIHSGISEQQRLQSWLKARSGEARIIIGTRSALFVPLQNPGIIIIDEEHDSSFKQQQGLRYSARDVAMVRGKIENTPVLLGSASPSIESLLNVKNGKISQLDLPAKALTTKALSYRLVDLKNQPMKQGLSFALIDAISHHLKNKGQILLFLNRRGYSPVLLCHHCGWSSQCKRCDTHFTFHGTVHKNEIKEGDTQQQSVQGHLQCHHCGSSRQIPKRCPECLTDEMVPVGLGTERLEQSIKQLFPKARVRRIDRDTTRKKNAMNQFVDEIKSGQVDILIGTQMLAKGHHFPDVTLVGMVDMDGALYSSDFRAPEYAAQLITQVSGRAGRADKPGEIMIQTHHADHPMLMQLINSGYQSFAKTAMQERISVQLPPHSFSALFQAEATYLGHAKTFLQEVKQLLNQARVNQDPASVQILGPVPAHYTKKAGKFRYQLFVESSVRLELHQLLDMTLIAVENLKSASRVRWRMEVDPIGD